MIGKRHFILAILLVLSIALVAGCTGSNNANNTTASPSGGNPTTLPAQNVTYNSNVPANYMVKAGDNVSVEYTGWLDNGTIFDTSNATVAKQAGIYNANGAYTPLSFIVGEGEVISGFDSAVVGMKVGDSKNISIAPKDAYGEYNESLIQPVSMDILTQANITPHVNDTLYYGIYMEPVTVHSIPNNTTVMIDFNHPLAGKTLHFNIKLLSVQEAITK